MALFLLDEYVLHIMISFITRHDVENLYLVIKNKYPVIKKILSERLRPTTVYLINQEGAGKFDEPWHQTMCFSRSVTNLRKFCETRPNSFKLGDCIPWTISVVIRTQLQNAVFHKMEQGCSGIYVNGTLRVGARWECNIVTRGTVLHLLLENPDSQRLYAVYDLIVLMIKELLLLISNQKKQLYKNFNHLLVTRCIN